MGKHRLFTAQEWRGLQFAVLDIFMMVSQIDEPSGMDEAEQNAFIDLLVDPSPIEDELLREVLASIGPTWKHVLDAYNPQFRFTAHYFEKSFSRAKSLLDRKLDKKHAQSFKVALATQLGGIIANASGKSERGVGRLCDDELEAIAAISMWLGMDTKRLHTG